MNNIFCRNGTFYGTSTCNHVYVSRRWGGWIRVGNPPHVYESGGDTDEEGGLVLVIHLMYINQEGILMGRVD